MKIISPVAYATTDVPTVAKVQKLNQPKRAAILRNAWPAMGKIAEVANFRLRDKHGFGAVTEESFPTSSAAPEEVFDRVTRAGDFVIIGAAT